MPPWDMIWAQLSPSTPGDKMNLICPILGRDTEVERTVYGHASWSIVRCRETGFVFLENPPDYSRLESEFAWEKTSGEERIRRQTQAPWMTLVSSMAKSARGCIFPSRNKTASLALASILTKSGPTTTVLDVGCARGTLLLDLHQRCAQHGVTMVPLGIEVSRLQAHAAQEKMSAIGGRVIFANALDGIDALEAGSVDVVVMCSFLEHESHPLTCLKRVRRLLTNGGEVIVKVPNFASWNRKIRGKGWSGFRFPDHVNYFTPRTLKLLAVEAGFQVSRQNTLDRFPISDNMYAVLKKCSAVE